MGPVPGDPATLIRAYRKIASERRNVDRYSAMSIFQIRARFSQNRLTVYQGQTESVADASLAAGMLVLARKATGNIWITTSFLDALRDSQWAMRPGQQRILSFDMTRNGLEWALDKAVSSDFDSAVFDTETQWQRALAHSPVRIQWDQAIDLKSKPAGYVTPRLGLALEARDRFIDEWVSGISDVTSEVLQIHQLVLDENWEAAEALLPIEHQYPLRNSLRARLGLAA